MIYVLWLKVGRREHFSSCQHMSIASDLILLRKYGNECNTLLELSVSYTLEHCVLHTRRGGWNVMSLTGSVPLAAAVSWWWPLKECQVVCLLSACSRERGGSKIYVSYLEHIRLKAWPNAPFIKTLSCSLSAFIPWNYLKGDLKNCSSAVLPLEISPLWIKK